MHLLLPAELRSARTAARAAIDFDAAEGERLAIALTEIVTNIVRHGWRGSATDRIQLELTRDDEQALTATLRYPGLPFDWRLPARTASAMIAPLDLKGGLGLLVIHSFADDVLATSDGATQEVTIVRRLRTALPKAA